MSTTRWIIETPCAECGRFHLEAMLKPGGDPESSIAYCYTRGSRIVVDPDNLPPEAIQRARDAIHEARHTGDQAPVVEVRCDELAEVAITAFLSDPEPGDQT